MMRSSSHHDSINRVFEQVSLALTEHRKTVKYLDVMLSKLFGQRPPTSCQRVDSIVYCYLAILVVQEVINILAAFSHNLLPQKD